MAQPTRSVSALKKWPSAEVTYRVDRPGPPKQQLVGLRQAMGWGFQHPS